MRYIGGKHRIAKWLSQQILPLRQDRRLVEPFCGGLSATVALQPDLACDASVPLISLIQACRNGWEPPSDLSEDDYRWARTLPAEHPLHGFAAFCCSFGGKYWGGYARETGRNFAKEGRNALLRKIEATRKVEFQLMSFEQLKPGSGDLVYCDPPYAGTTMGYSTPVWNPETFWKWASESASRGAVLVVSEFNAPEGTRVLAQRESSTDLRTLRRDQQTVEKLFILGGLK